MKLGTRNEFTPPAADRHTALLPQMLRLPETWLIPVVATLVALLYTLLPTA